MLTYLYSCDVKAWFMLNFVCKIAFLCKGKPRLRRTGKRSYKAANGQKNGRFIEWILRAALKFGRRVHFALRRKMLKPPITRLPAS